MVKFFGGRLAAAIVGLLLVAAGSTAAAQDMSALGNVHGAVQQLEADRTGSTLAVIPALVPAVQLAAARSAVAVAQPVQSAAASTSQSIAREAAWLYKGGWPLSALVGKYGAGAALDEQANCLATAVFFEARGESLEGQLAVARVVMNRAASGRYPPDWCGVVKQHAQFSFVRHGQFPSLDSASAAWARAQAIARLAIANIVPSVEPDVLWYHANYVAPSWGFRLNLAERIGAHIFYRS